MPRLLIISNRLPVSITEENGELKLTPSAGGLATGLNSLNTENEVRWIGWPGITTSKKEKQQIITEKLEELKMTPVFIPKDKFDGFYNGFSNSTLWPLFHYFQQYSDFYEHTWRDYQWVNYLFAEQLFKVAKEDDIFWVQDYHLMLVPQLIRQQYPLASIGFFLHIPFPTFELMRTMPRRRELLNGVLGADLIGFHTHDYVRHFISAVRRILGHEHHLGRIRLQDRVVEVDSFPMGINYEKFANAVNLPETKVELERYERETGNFKIILSIDRLDYSKGLTQRVRAFNLFLKKYPQYRGKVVMIMIVVPSRDTIKHYNQLKEELDKRVGSLNSKYGDITWTPVRYYYRSISFPRLIAWYKMAPVALVTPFRDGMNLVSKEYVATKDDGKGVLILSEMAGASKELISALQVNPNNLHHIADSIYRALEMDEEEQIERNRAMQKVIERNNVNRWATTFLTNLKEVRSKSLNILGNHFNTEKETKLVKAYKKSKSRLILLDYDGTLVNFRSNPNSARPTKTVFNIIDNLSKNELNRVVLISGRDKEILEKWFGEYPIDIIAEHGAWHRKNGNDWSQIKKLNADWKKTISPIFQQFVDRTPGSFIEEKNYSLAWHFRKTDPGLAEIRKPEFLEQLSHVITGKSLQIMEGNKVLEVKNDQINKGKAAQKWLKEKDWQFVLAIGDDYTDEDTFKVLPPEAYSLKVGFSETAARYNINSVEQVLSLLAKLT
ncbi:MAG: bifunctional alpha,alpha-trehalose-phosphate synthase (UDP-forming)/trehalose-phosphatase [Cyclobacteriaceae bacterium]|nr:bifunctional alpha,alpha-trehalose-phosphate synthase (UDP-forming)/trehalose-phosphatase [Cyclobacteriaceae bacterium]